MHNLILFLIPFVLLSAAEKPQRAKKASSAPAAAAAPRPAATAPVAIPAGAVEIEPYLFRHADKDGKVWLYRKTPFGISRTEEKVRDEAADRQQSAAATRIVRVTDKGDTVRFERSTPMGSQSWEKKRVELTVEEKAWLEKNAQASSRPEK